MLASVTRKLGLALAFGASAQTGTTGTTGAAGSTGSAAATSGSKASTGAGSASKAARNPDHSFVEKAAIGGMAEVELGNLAQQKASSDQVKQFASRMVQDHGKANDELKQIASSKGMDLPTALDKKHRGDVDRLGKMSGAQFDRAYMSHMVDDHKKDVADFKKASTSAKDSDVKGFASKTLPTLQEHLQLAQKTNDAVKKSNGKSTGSKTAQ
jgi:putative membrane protein